METLRQAALEKFEEEMVAHTKEFLPQLCKVLGDDRLRTVLRHTLRRARDYGFTNRGPARLFIEMTFLLGSDFATDPQYTWAEKSLGASGDQMQRSAHLHEKIVDYQARIFEPEELVARKALRSLSALSELFEPPCDKVGLSREIGRIFPKKAAYIGEMALTALIQKSHAEARKFNLPMARGEALLLVLMLALGHGCTVDPLHPWIAETLKNEKGGQGGPTVRAEALEKSWIVHVSTMPCGRSQS